MKREMSLRQGMLIRFLTATLIPVFILSVATQANIVRNHRNNVEERSREDLNMSNLGLDMLLDKYATILYDLCTDDDVMEAVESINSAEDVLGMNSSMLQHRLSHICNRNEGITGIMVSLSGGEVLFYDTLNSSSTNSQWVKKAGMPDVGKGNVYRGITEPILVNGEKFYIFQIARNLIDYRDISQIQGTVTISISEEQICKVLNSGEETQSYLLDGSTVLSSVLKGDIGRNYGELIDLEENKYTTRLNETSGFTVCNIQPVKAYNESMQLQYFVFGMVVLLTVLAVVIATHKATEPYLKAVDDYVEAMTKLEAGDFAVRVKPEEDMAPELCRIMGGFNDMVAHIESLIVQVQQASLEQRNAEMSALEAQIDPHFLYNTLDTINWKAIENEQYEISEMLGALADILRYTVKNAGGVTTLRMELEWLERYMLLQGMKLGRRPELQVKVPEELMDVLLHKLLLQPFVENTMKYAFTNKDEERQLLVIRAKRVDDQIHLSIGDNGKGIDIELLKKLNDESADMGEHVGIVNVRKRLKLYYGEAATVYFESIRGSYTRVHLFIPLETEDSGGKVVK